MAKTAHLPLLDPVRGLLAAHVMLFHFVQSLPALDAQITSRFFDFAPISVDAFFLMSGMVIAHVYGARTFTRSSFGDFMLARVARLAPLNLLTLVLLIPLVAAGLVLKPGFGAEQVTADAGKFSLSTFWINALLLQGPFGSGSTWVYPSWSVSLEMVCYLLFPLLAAGAFVVRGRAALYGLAALSIAVAAAMLWASDAGRMDHYPTHGPLSLLRGVPLFFAGIVLYRANALGLGPKGALADSLFWGGAGLFFLAAVFAEQRLIGLAGGVAMLIGALGASAKTAQIVERRPLVMLGELAYTIYMLHAVVHLYGLEIADFGLKAVLGVQDFSKTVSGLPAIGVLVGLALVTIAASFVIKRGFEDPARIAIRRLAKGKPQAAATV